MYSVGTRYKWLCVVLRITACVFECLGCTCVMLCECVSTPLSPPHESCFILKHILQSGALCQSYFKCGAEKNMVT